MSHDEGRPLAPLGPPFVRHAECAMPRRGVVRIAPRGRRRWRRLVFPHLLGGPQRIGMSLETIDVFDHLAEDGRSDPTVFDRTIDDNQAALRVHTEMGGRTIVGL